MKMMSRGSRKAVRKLMMVSAPMMPKPDATLSPMLCKVVLSVIRGLKNRGIAALLVEQNARAALRIADRGYVMRVGRITAQGGAQDLAESPDIQRAYLGL